MSTQTEKEGLALGDIFTAVLAFILITVLMVVLLQIGFYLMRDQEVERKFVVSEEYENLRTVQERTLAQPVGWADEEKTRVTMPIDAAMDAVVRKHATEIEAP